YAKYDSQSGNYYIIAYDLDDEEIRDGITKQLVGSNVSIIQGEAGVQYIKVEVKGLSPGKKDIILSNPYGAVIAHEWFEVEPYSYKPKIDYVVDELEWDEEPVPPKSPVSGGKNFYIVGENFQTYANMRPSVWLGSTNGETEQSWVEADVVSITRVKIPGLNNEEKAVITARAP